MWQGKTPLCVRKSGLRVVFAKVPGASGEAKHHSMREKLACELCSPKFQVPQVKQNTTRCTKNWPASGVCRGSRRLRRGKTPPMREKLACGWCLPRSRHHYILYTPRQPAASTRLRISSFSVVYRPSFFMRSKYSPPANVNLAERPSGSMRLMSE